MRIFIIIIIILSVHLKFSITLTLKQTKLISSSSVINLVFFCCFFYVLSALVYVIACLFSPTQGPWYLMKPDEQYTAPKPMISPPFHSFASFSIIVSRPFLIQRNTSIKFTFLPFLWKWRARLLHDHNGTPDCSLSSVPFFFRRSWIKLKKGRKSIHFG